MMSQPAADCRIRGVRAHALMQIFPFLLKPRIPSSPNRRSLALKPIPKAPESISGSCLLRTCETDFLRNMRPYHSIFRRLPNT